MGRAVKGKGHFLSRSEDKDCKTRRARYAARKKGDGSQTAPVAFTFFDPAQDISSAKISKCCLFALVTVIVTVWVFTSLEA